MLSFLSMIILRNLVYRS